MELWEFNSNDLTNLLDNLSAENITVVLLGDFNENPFIYDQNKNISDFLDLMYFSISIRSHIFSSTHTTTTPVTPIDSNHQ